MKLAIILSVALWAILAAAETLPQEKQKGHLQRVTRQTSSSGTSASADQMVQNILQWLQGVYTQNARKIRQGTLREYLPPSNTQKPRPFEPQGYPPSGITPQPPFNPYPSPTTSNGGYPSPNNDITPPYNGYPSSQTPQPPFPGYPGQRPGFPTQRPTFPPQTGYPGGRPSFPPQPPPTGYPGGRPSFPPATGYPTQRPSLPPRVNIPSERPTFPTQTPPTAPPSYPTQRPSFPTQPPVTAYPTNRPTFPTTGYPTTTEEAQTPAPVTHYTSPVITTPEGSSPTTTISPDENNVVPTSRPDETETPEVSVPPRIGGDDDLNHPPHIHAIEVECAKDMMTISIEFNREFNGVIYSKGFYDNPECRYVNENSEQTKYKFTVNLNSCGTEFINAFDTQGQSYLENILVIQNEQGIQEVWDTIRAVRCLWEGNLKDSLSVALSVGMLSQEIVTFSGDTAMAKLDIQLGRGPFAPAANGLVKIGEQMTLVISVSGDPGFDIQVKDCKATDSTGDRVYPLTDEEGCILKPKLFGAFQKTRNAGNTGASIIAYAFFNAFKFPDVMDLMIQCNIELCKTDCQVCNEPGQQVEPGRRRRRDLSSYKNNTIGDGVVMGKHLRVILPEELKESGYAVVDVDEIGGVCMTKQNFVLSSVIMVSLLTVSCLVSACLWLKNQRLASKM